ncbi:MAG: leucine-rich repeat domain-containing protein [Chitinispirillaceae bacterium]|nr:leucine-rich repeat domain-containing protein [Chitinispirillaceae bacterium]
MKRIELLASLLCISWTLSAQDGSFLENDASAVYDDYTTLKGILNECGIGDSRLSTVSVMENGRVVFLDLSNKEISKDGIRALPYAIGNLAELRTLIARDNVITSIPDAVMRLTKLRTLILSHNKIVSIPPEIGQLENLDTLDLRHNSFETLPDEIGKLKNLSYLQLWGNKLATLPPSLLRLSSLRELYLKNNRLVSLPEGLITMKSLIYIDFQGNAICNPSPKLEAWLKGKDKQYRAQQRCPR